jgi:hypothetical protein
LRTLHYGCLRRRNRYLRVQLVETHRTSQGRIIEQVADLHVGAMRAGSTAFVAITITAAGVSLVNSVNLKVGTGLAAA